MEPFDAFGATMQTTGLLMRIQDYQNEQERMQLAREAASLAREEQIKKNEYQANNDLLDGLWKAVTDKSTPPELAEHLRDFADDYSRTMVRQQAQMLDVITARGLYSEEDRKLDQFNRIYKGRPSADLSKVSENELIPKMAELRVAQAEYDTKKENFMREGTGMEKVKNPALVPVTNFLDKEDKPHSIFGRRDPNTGRITTIDTGSDLEGDMFLKAVQSGMSPSTMATNDFIPFPDSKEKIITTGGKKYSMRVGQSLTDGSLKTMKVELGDDDSGSKGKGLQVPANVINTLDMMNSAAAGTIPEDKYGKYGDVIQSFKELENIDLKGTDASKSKEFMNSLLNKEIATNRKYRGWVIAPVYDKKPSGWFGYYQHDGRYFAFPADTRTQISINGKVNTLWYKEKIEGQQGSHFWHDAFGNHLEFLDGKAPGSVIESKTLQEVDASKVVGSKSKENKKIGIEKPIKTISFGEWLIKDAHRRSTQSRKSLGQIKLENAKQAKVPLGEKINQGWQQGKEQIMNENYMALFSKLPVTLIEKLMNIQVPVEDE